MNVSSVPVRVLVAGAGAFGWEHLTRLLGRTDVHLAGIADPNPAALERVRSLAGAIRLCADPLQMIAEEKADAIIVAAPVELSCRNLCASAQVEPVRPLGEASGSDGRRRSRTAGFRVRVGRVRFAWPYPSVLEGSSKAHGRRAVRPAWEANLYEFAPLQRRVLTRSDTPMSIRS